MIVVTEIMRTSKFNSNTKADQTLNNQLLRNQYYKNLVRSILQIINVCIITNYHLAAPWSIKVVSSKNYLTT